MTLDHFLTGLDALGTGRLMFQVLDPDKLDRFLSAIRRQLWEERSPFELAFNHTYQFYAEPMVMFTNTHDQLHVNVPILLRLTTQKPLNLYSIDTVPMPFDTETLEGKNNEYTFATKLGRQGCRRKTETCRPNDRLDNNILNHTSTFGNPIHNI